MQVFVKGSAEALDFYQKAFNAKVLCAYFSPDGTRLEHSELDVYGQVLAVSELLDGEAASGSTMMFCLHMGQGSEAEVERIYETLKEGAVVTSPLGSCSYSPLETDLVDRFGVRWCIFV